MTTDTTRTLRIGFLSAVTAVMRDAFPGDCPEEWKQFLLDESAELKLPEPLTLKDAIQSAIDLTKQLREESCKSAT